MEVEHSPNPQTSRGIYGFVLFLMFVTFITSYFLWILIPTSITKTWSYEPPQKYWAAAVPIFFCTILFLFAFFIYPAMCSLHDGRLDSLTAIQDSFTMIAPSPEVTVVGSGESELEGRPRTRSSIRKGDAPARPESIVDLKLYGNNTDVHPQRRIPPASDLDINDVCQLLYLRNKS